MKYIHFLYIEALEKKKNAILGLVGLLSYLLLRYRPSKCFSLFASSIRVAVAATPSIQKHHRPFCTTLDKSCAIHKCICNRPAHSKDIWCILYAICYLLYALCLKSEHLDDQKKKKNKKNGGIVESGKAVWTHDSILFHVAALLLLLIKSGAKSFVVQRRQKGTGCVVSTQVAFTPFPYCHFSFLFFGCGSITRQQTHGDME